LNGERCTGGAQVLVQKDAREAPAHHPGRAVPQRESKVRDGHRYFTEHRRPELANPQRSAAVRQIDECEPDTELRLLIPKRRRRGKRPEEIGFERGPRRPFAEHRRAVEGEVDARVADVAVKDRLVGRRLAGGARGRCRVLGVLPLPEVAEQPVVVKHRGAYEAADGERLSLTELDHLLS